MSGRPSGVLPGDLLEARTRMRAWRSRRARGSRIPADLWTLAVNLAKVHGASRTATTLGLDYYGLKRRLSNKSSSRTSPSAAFVELPVPLAAGKQCQAELTNGSGAVLRLQLSGYESTDLAALVARLWSGD